MCLSPEQVMSKDYMSKLLFYLSWTIGFGTPCHVNVRTELKCKCCVVHLYRWTDVLGKRKSGATQ